MQAFDKLVKGCAWLPDFKMRYSWRLNSPTIRTTIYTHIQCQL